MTYNVAINLRCKITKDLIILIFHQGTTRSIDVIEYITNYEKPIEVHLDTRCRWIRPDGDMYAREFECPFRGGAEKLQSGDSCSQHVNDVGHPKKGGNTDKN